MTSPVASLDWSLVQAFLAVAEHGSLSAAARNLGASQPTLGRQVRAMEEQLGVELFVRSEKGFDLTDTGHSLLGAARAMRQAVNDIQLRASATSNGLEGTVRITASIVVATAHLPRIIAQLREREPRIAIELLASDEPSNLHFREADIAVRMFRPTQSDLVTQYLGELEIGVFASRNYLERRGSPEKPEDVLRHDVIGFDKSTAIIDGFRQLGYDVTREWFGVRCDDPNAYWELVRAGCGLGFAQTAVGRRDPLLVEVPLELKLPRLPVWLTTHESLRHTPRVRRVWEVLMQGLREVFAEGELPRASG